MGLGDAQPPCSRRARLAPDSRARWPANHLRDDHRNSLVGRVGDYAALLRPDIVLIENARELVTGRFSGHLRSLSGQLAALGYQVAARTHFLTGFGLPQRRERAIIIAVRRPLRARGLADLWGGWRVDSKATHVRRAIWDLPAVGAGLAHPADPLHVAPAFRSAESTVGG